MDCIKYFFGYFSFSEKKQVREKIPSWGFSFDAQSFEESTLDVLKSQKILTVCWKISKPTKHQFGELANPSNRMFKIDLEESKHFLLENLRDMLEKNNCGQTK
jgi:hypothetical protein